MKKALRNFSSDRRGNVAIIFALTAIPAMLLTGIGIDYARALSVRSQLQNAADAAAFAAAAAGSKTEAQRLAIAEKVFTNNAKKVLDHYSVHHNINIDIGTVTITTSVDVPTAFMKLLPLTARNGEQLQQTTEVSGTLPVETTTTVQTAGKTLELALMLDVTGSMRGQKIRDLKWAAKDLMDIVMPSGGAGSPTRIALVPFSNRVNAGKFASQVTGLPETYQKPRRVCSRYSRYSRYGKKRCVKYRYVTYGSLQHLKTCVTERQGSYRYTDEEPGTGSYVGSYYPGYSISSQYSSTGYCSIPKVIPLSTNRDMLRNHIDSFTANGGTAGHLGTAWAWYMVSPKWNTVWDGDSHAQDYDEKTNIKAVVLMTDGGFNTDYTSGLTSTQMARQLCTRMKQAGVVVYTVGFGIQPNTTQRQTMMQCASSPDHYFFPYDGAQLREAFRSIGQALAYAQGNPHLSN